MSARNIVPLTIVSLACAIGSTVLRAQSAPSGSPGKIGILNLRQAVGSTAEGKQASTELQSQFGPRQNELEALNKQVNDLRQRLDACQSTCSDEEKQRLTVQGQRLTRQLDRKNNELQEDVNQAQGEVIDRIGRKMMDVLDRYARENGFVLIVDSSAQNSPLLYAITNVDVTQDMIRLYDQAYPVKGASATPATKPAPSSKPAPAPKPAAPPPAKP